MARCEYALVYDGNFPHSGPRSPESPSVWDYIDAAPGWPHSILIQDDGSVVVKESPTQLETKRARTYIGGGRKFTVFDDDPDYAALVNAGFAFELVRCYDVSGYGFGGYGLGPYGGSV